MKGWLRKARCYCYTGTQPASYTLGLIEALMTGIPTVSIGPSWMTIFPYGPDLFEGREICLRGGDDPKHVRGQIARLLEHPDPNPPERARAIELFGKETVGAAWREFLGTPKGMHGDVARSTKPQDVKPRGSLVSPMVMAVNGADEAA
jgi:hypothetical protein